MELLSTLRHAKAISESCSERLQEQQRAQAAADATLSLYSPVAKRASSLFQVLQQLETAHPMYLFSVQTFQQCFVDAVLVRDTPSLTALTNRHFINERGCQHHFASSDIESFARISSRLLGPCLALGHSGGLRKARFYQQATRCWPVHGRFSWCNAETSLSQHSPLPF